MLITFVLSKICKKEKENAIMSTARSTILWCTEFEWKPCPQRMSAKSRGKKTWPNKLIAKRKKKNPPPNSKYFKIFVFIKN